MPERGSFTDEQLRRLTTYVHPDEATDYVRPWLQSIAGELLELRTAYARLKVETQEDYVAIEAKQDRDAQTIATIQRAYRDLHASFDVLMAERKQVTELADRLEAATDFGTGNPSIVARAPIGEVDGRG